MRKIVSLFLLNVLHYSFCNVCHITILSSQCTVLLKSEVRVRLGACCTHGKAVFNSGKTINLANQYEDGA